MKKLIVFTLIIAGFIFNASGEELLEVVPMQDDSNASFFKDDTDKNYLVLAGYNSDISIFEIMNPLTDGIYYFGETIHFKDVLKSQGYGKNYEEIVNLYSFTRHFFNDDDKFEYIATSKANDPNPWWGIKNSDGDFLYKENNENAWCAYYFGTGAGKFLCINGKKLYKIKNSSGNVLINLSEAQRKAYPNPVKRGEIFNIDIDNLNLTDKSVLMISAINGSMKSKRTVDLDDRSVTVGTGDMEPGIYIYSLTSNNKVLKSGRIIIE